MEANYVGPGWYWIYNEEDPAWVEHKAGDVYVATYQNVCEFLINKASIITHIPRPIPRPVVDWSVMPAWAKWVAMDDEGSWHWYVYKPYTEEYETGWYLGSGSIHDYAKIPKDHSPTYTGDWKNSLVERPE